MQKTCQKTVRTTSMLGWHFLIHSHHPHMKEGYNQPWWQALRRQLWGSFATNMRIQLHQRWIKMGEYYYHNHGDGIKQFCHIMLPWPDLLASNVHEYPSFSSVAPSNYPFTTPWDWSHCWSLAALSRRRLAKLTRQGPVEVAAWSELYSESPRTSHEHRKLSSKTCVMCHFLWLWGFPMTGLW